MERIPVKSSNVDSVGYDEGTKTLEIQYKGKPSKPSAIYQYPGVEPQTHADLMGAESIGKFVQQNIVKAGFKAQKMDPEPKDE
jgi:hypothetical protein